MTVYFSNHLKQGIRQWTPDWLRTEVWRRGNSCTSPRSVVSPSYSWPRPPAPTCSLRLPPPWPPRPPPGACSCMSGITGGPRTSLPSVWFPPSIRFLFRLLQSCLGLLWCPLLHCSWFLQHHYLLHLPSFWFLLYHHLQTRFLYFDVFLMVFFRSLWIFFFCLVPFQRHKGIS